jgi:hypothetical protein
MIMALPNHSRSVGDTTPGVPLTGKCARKGKRANLLLDRSGPCTKGGSPGPRSKPFGCEFRNSAEVSE